MADRRCTRKIASPSKSRDCPALLSRYERDGNVRGIGISSGDCKMAVECRPPTFALIAWPGKDGGMNQKPYSQILNQVARDQMAANTDLAPRILARIQKGKSKTMQPRTKVFAMAILILLVLVIGLVSVP